MPGEHQKQVNFIRLYRKKQGLTQKELASLLGFKSSSSISNYERGKKMPGLEVLLKLEIACRTPGAFLYRTHYLKLKKELRQKEEELKQGDNNSVKKNRYAK